MNPRTIRRVLQSPVDKIQNLENSKHTISGDSLAALSIKSAQTQDTEDSQKASLYDSTDDNDDYYNADDQRSIQSSDNYENIEPEASRTFLLVSQL